VFRSLKGTYSNLMQIFSFLFNKRLYPLWIAGQICFNLVNGDVIAVQGDDHNWGDNADHGISYCLNPLENGDPSSPCSSLPDPHATTGYGTLISTPPAIVVADDIDHDHFHNNSSYLLYLLKRPPPPVHTAV